MVSHVSHVFTCGFQCRVSCVEHIKLLFQGWWFEEKKTSYLSTAWYTIHIFINTRTFQNPSKPNPIPSLADSVGGGGGYFARQNTFTLFLLPNRAILKMFMHFTFSVPSVSGNNTLRWKLRGKSGSDASRNVHPFDCIVSTIISLDKVMH